MPAPFRSELVSQTNLPRPEEIFEGYSAAIDPNDVSTIASLEMNNFLFI
jgi:hypothetical protein